MRIAIAGDSCSGKTTVASMLGSRLELPVRHCGRRVAEEAADQESGLPVGRHLEIDRETQQVVSAADDGIIVEGCFLEFVLRDIPGVFLVALECDEGERSRRAVQKGDDLETRDRADRLLISSIYDDQGRRLPDLRIDTTALRPTDVEATIIAAISADGSRA